MAITESIFSGAVSSVLREQVSDARYLMLLFRSGWHNYEMMTVSTISTVLCICTLLCRACDRTVSKHGPLYGLVLWRWQYLIPLGAEALHRASAPCRFCMHSLDGLCLAWCTFNALRHEYLLHTLQSPLCNFSMLCVTQDSSSSVSMVCPIS